jgi:hypothetical protein
MRPQMPSRGRIDRLPTAAIAAFAPSSRRHRTGRTVDRSEFQSEPLMRASLEPAAFRPFLSTLARGVRVVLVLVVGVAVLAPGGAPSWAQSDDPSQEAATRLEALDRATRGQGPQTCFDRRQAMAIETQRVYAELLVAALACERFYGLADGYETYVDFSTRHEGLLTETQGTLERYLGSTAAFDSYVTRLANEQTQQLAEYGTGRYCEIHSSRFDSLIDAAPGSVRGYMEELAGRLLARQRGC